MLSFDRLSSYQLETLRIRYFDPYIELLRDEIESLVSDNQKQYLSDLIKIVSQQNLTINQMKLQIAETIAEKDFKLKNDIAALFPEHDESALDGIYNTLYRLLHEIRLNKNPDCDEYIQEHNAHFIQVYNENVDDLYELTIQKVKRISERLSDLTDSDTPLSDQAIENAFLSFCDNLIKEFSPAAEFVDLNPDLNQELSYYEELKQAIELSKELDKTKDLTPIDAKDAQEILFNFYHQQKIQIENDERYAYELAKKFESPKL